MRWFHVLTLIAPMVCIIFLFVLGCSAVSPRHEVVRDVNAAWNETGNGLLIVESRFSTSRPHEPHFNASKSRDWRVVLYRVGRPAKTKSSNGPLELTGRKKIGGWKEDANPGGSIMYSPIYWLEQRKRLVGMQNQRPFLYDFENKRLMEPDPPMEVKRRMVGARLAEGVFGRGATPSPDGRFVGVLYSIGYSKKAGIAQLHFAHFMSFFSTRDGRHLHSVPIQWPNDTTDLEIVPRAHEIPKRYRFLWSKNSDGVYLASLGHALFVPTAKNGKVTRAMQLPAHAVAVGGGPVSDRGEFVYLMENHGHPNQRKLGLRLIKNWTPFQRIPLVPAPRTKYFR